MLIWTHLTEGDAVSRLVALVLLAMSVASWVVIVCQCRVHWGAHRTLEAGIALFWSSADAQQARARLMATDPHRWVLPLVELALDERTPAQGLAGWGSAEQRLTRGLRDVLDHAQRRLLFGQVLLASVGATAPFVGLLGTVWGVYGALVGLAADGPLVMSQVSGPVGEALVMTAAGLAVALPAVLAYNTFGRLAAQVQGRLDALAHDLLGLAQTARGHAPGA
jgi:biopolymer transport protein ExbB